MSRRLWIIAFFSAAGCASAPETPPPVLAGNAAYSRVEAGIENATDEANGLDTYDISVRYNPARCDCPDFEVEVFGAWERAYIVAPAPTRARLDDMAESNQALAELTVKGRITSATRRAETRVSYPVFEVEEP